MMHELSLVRSLLDIVDRYGEDQGFRKVNSLRLSFGILSSIDSLALSFAFDTLSKQTVAEGARLDLEIIPALVYCFDCEKEIGTESYQGVCPACKGSRIILTGGTEELKLIEMDVD